MNIQTIVVAGAGTMGSSMAQIFAKYHDHVVIYNHREVTLNKAKERIQENVQNLVQSHIQRIGIAFRPVIWL